MATRRPTLPTSAQMRTQVLDAIAERLALGGLTQKEAAAQLGLAQPQVSALMNRKSEGFSLDRLIDIAVRAGLSVRLSVARPYRRD
ncbi:MAG: helix-turn-helix domain-containing protein [Betaproteobacteria bacterium]|jgi:predicted XRE-type DNA-binding protein|nr:helix-turn-helix domain-containing protein [Betaproteobacteria bacterium]NBX88486.1 helix-turn-helix domain-containing protein [Betaproteobacteria bacterium]